MVAFADRVVLVDPVDGAPVRLRDPDGRVRLDEQGNPRSWVVQVSGQSPAHFYAQAVDVGEDTLLLTSYEGRAYRVDFVTARVLNADGTALPGRTVATPVLGDSLLYLPLSEVNLAALRRDTLERVWTLSTERGVWASPLLLDGVLYVPSMDHSLYAVDAETGEPRWASPLNLGGAVAATPVFANGHLYVGSFGRKVYKITLDGQIVSSFDTEEWVWGAPAVVGDMVYAADLGGNVYAVQDRGREFRPVWSRKVAQRAIRATPLVTDDAIIVGSRDHFVYWISPLTGEEIQRREVAGEVLADLLLLTPGDTLAIREPMIIVSTLTRAELLVAFTLDDGERRWVFGL